jgi:hypothetical protein
MVSDLEGFNIEESKARRREKKAKCRPVLDSLVEQFGFDTVVEELIEATHRGGSAGAFMLPLLRRCPVEDLLCWVETTKGGIGILHGLVGVWDRQTADHYEMQEKFEQAALEETDPEEEDCYEELAEREKELAEELVAKKKVIFEAIEKLQHLEPPQKF